MTRTEEQRPTAGFDLEKARDVEKAMSPMPWIVLEEAHGEMIIIRNPNHPMYIDGTVAWGRVAEANTPDAIGIAYMRENFSNLIGEIERLRASLIDLHAEYINTLEKNPDCSAWDLDEQSDAVDDDLRLFKHAFADPIENDSNEGVFIKVGDEGFILFANGQRGGEFIHHILQ